MLSVAQRRRAAVATARIRFKPAVDRTKELPHVKCLICEHEAKPLDSGGPGLALRCRECGSYQVDDRLLARLRQGRDILDEQQARIRLHVRRAGHHGLPRLDAADADLLQPRPRIDDWIRDISSC